MDWISSFSNILVHKPDEPKNQSPSHFFGDVKPMYYVYIPTDQLLKKPSKSSAHYYSANIDQDGRIEKWYFSKQCLVQRTRHIAADNLSGYTRISVKYKIYLSAFTDTELAKKYDKKMIHHLRGKKDISAQRAAQVKAIIRQLEQEKKQSDTQKRLLFREGTANSSFSNLLRKHELCTLLQNYSAHELAEKFERQFSTESLSNILAHLNWSVFISAEGRKIIGFDKRFHQKGELSYMQHNKLVTYTFRPAEIRYLAIGSHGNILQDSVVSLSLTA